MTQVLGESLGLLSIVGATSVILIFKFSCFLKLIDNVEQVGKAFV